MNQLLIAAQAYISACNIVNPMAPPPIFTTNPVLKSPAAARLEWAKEAVKEAERAVKCESATQKFIDEVEKERSK